MVTLKPTTIHLESTLKLFGLENGRSDGSTLGIDFTVEPGAGDEKDDLRNAILQEKERLDVLVATMELAKGTYPRSRYDAWREQHRRAFDTLLKRKPKEP